jgi:transposase
MKGVAMTRRGPKLVPVVLTGGQRSALETRAASAEPREALRAEIVLAAAEGRSNGEIAAMMQCSENTVSAWRTRFVEGGVGALEDRPRVAVNGRSGRPLPALELTAEQREVLERWCRRPKTAAGLVQRSRIVLLAADGLSNKEVAERVGCNPATVTRWRTRFLAEGLAGLSDEHRSGRPRTIADEAVETVITKTLEELPTDGSTHWSTRSMAQAVGLSQPTISRIWRRFGLAPHRVDTFKLSTDPNFIDKVHDVVGLYLNPPERAIVICVDEKTGVQAIDRTQPSFPMLPGTPATATHDYIRNGTVDLFAALNIGTGQVIARTDSQHRAIEFRKFLDQIADNVPADLDVHVVLDNASTHKTPAIKKWLQRHPRFEFHFTPTSSSWLNLVERWFAELTNKKLRRSAHRNVQALAHDIINWAEHWNDNPRPYVWHKTADEILENLKRYCQRISDSGH